MIILKIKGKKGQFFKIFANDEFLGFFSKNSIKNLKIKNNKEYSIEEVKKIKIIGQFKYAEKKAIDLLRIKDYSEKELFLKLEKYVPSKIAKFVVLKMKKLGFVNNLKYAENLAKKLIFVKNKSKQFAKFEIIKKGINKEIAEKVLDSLNFNSVEILEKLIIKKYIHKIKDFNSKQKAISNILKLGYSLEETSHAFKNLNLNF